MANEWRSRSCQFTGDWSSSGDSELATVGSPDPDPDPECETESSLEEKQSYAVFSSFSYDSRDNLNAAVEANQLATVGQSLAEPPTPRMPFHSAKSTSALLSGRQYDRISEDPSGDCKL